MRPARFTPTGGYAGDCLRLIGFLLAAPVLIVRGLPAIWREWRAARALPKHYRVIHTKGKR